MIDFLLTSTKNKKVNAKLYCQICRDMSRKKSDSTLYSKVKTWENIYNNHKEYQLINPFSHWDGASHRERLSTSDSNYGKPITGSFAEILGKEAEMLIKKEVRQLINVIRSRGKVTEDKVVFISFGDLFNSYNAISNKLVGLLIKARKQKLVSFDGEILFQNRNENVIICLNKNMSGNK